jgi:hypothetical protein
MAFQMSTAFDHARSSPVCRAPAAAAVVCAAMAVLLAWAQVSVSAEAEPLPSIAAAIDAPPAAVEPVPTPVPLYVPDPLDTDAFAGLPAAVLPAAPPQWPRWFAGATGLVMTRTLPVGTPTMQPLAGVTQLRTSSAAVSWPGGVDLHIGRWFGPQQRNAVEFIYWGVYGMDSSAAVSGSGINAIPQASNATVGGLPAADYLTGATAQQISRSDLVNDIEVNWLYAPGDRPEFLSRDPADGSRPMSLIWLAGFRFFQLEDVLTLATTSGDPALAATPLDFAVATNNNLYGGQLGAKFDWRLLPRVRFSTVSKFLLAGNTITNTSSLATSTGTQAVFASGAPVNVHSTLGVFSWLGSADTGLAWDVTDHWSLSVGYRVVGVGNIAQADGQWPGDITTAADLSGITAGSSTIIHGGFAGFEARY